MIFSQRASRAARIDVVRASRALRFDMRNARFARISSCYDNCVGLGLVTFYWIFPLNFTKTAKTKQKPVKIYLPFARSKIGYFQDFELENRRCRDFWSPGVWGG